MFKVNNQSAVIEFIKKWCLGKYSPIIFSYNLVPYKNDFQRRYTTRYFCYLITPLDKQVEKLIGLVFHWHENFASSTKILLEVIHSVRTQNFPKNYYSSYLLICTRTCVYQGVRNHSFTENFAYVLNEWSLTQSWSLWTKDDGITVI